jgi:hypothetical protein
VARGFDTEFQNGNPPEGFKIRGTDGALIEATGGIWMNLFGYHG